MTSDIYFKALDTIIKLLPYLKSFTGERRKDYFDKLLKPLYEAVEDVHDFYNDLFLGTRKKLIDLKVKQISFFSSDPEYSIDALKELEKIKTEFLDLRREDEILRYGLRQDAQEDFTKIQWIEEKRCLTSIIYYFLGEGSITPEDSDIDSDIEEVDQQGGIRYWNTPSISLYHDIQNLKDPEEILQKIDDARNELNQRFMNIRKQYRKVQNVLVLKT
jgi:hypothetical protein